MSALYQMWRDKLDREEWEERCRSEMLAELAYTHFGGPRPAHLGPEPPSLWRRFSWWLGQMWSTP